MNVKIEFLIIGITIGLLPELLNLNNFLDYNSKVVLGMTLIMIFFWITEAIPNSITALIPIILSPILIDIDLKEILSKYASPVVFLLLGGFLLASGFEKSNLHKRLALKSILAFGSTKKNLLLCCIFLTSFLSMWLSNTATCLLMLPIIKFLVDNSLEKKNDEYFSKILILSVAYSSSIGGMMTPIGTIPNAILIGFLNENYDIQIDFLSWFIFVAPLAIFMLLCVWLYFSIKIKKDNTGVDKTFIDSKYKELGTFSIKEKITSIILSSTAFLWIFKSKINSLLDINLTDSSIAIMCASLFFIIPTDKNFKVILDKQWFKDIPWNVLILFGGGLAMAALIVNTGLAKNMSEFLNFFKDYEVIVLILALTFFTSIITEFTSNTATTFLFLPLFASFAVESNMNVVQITIPIILAASCAYMMPISTPPNAIVYSTNRFSIQFMVKTGFILNIISIFLITFYVNFINSSLFRI